MSLKNGFGLLGGGVTFAVVLAAVTAFSTYYTIDEGERGVVLRNGRVIETSTPGLHFKMPFVDTVHDISTRTHSAQFKGQAYTQDQQTTQFVISINFNVDPSQVQELYSRYQNINNLVGRLLERVVPTEVKNTFGQYNAFSAIKERPSLIAHIEDKIKNAVKDEPIKIESVQIEDIEFSKAYEKSIEDRMMAEVSIATRKQNLETEKVNAEINVTQARAKADAQLAQAEAEAKAIKLRGEAEAEAIRLKSEALKQNPSLVALTAAEKWDGKLPETMLPNGSIPMIQLNQREVTSGKIE